MDEENSRAVTLNQVVAWNVAYYRRVAGLTQKQLGDKIGWTGAAVSEAERSWDGRRVREFDAQALANLSLALGVPLLALLLPPEGAEGTSIAGAAGEYDFGHLLARVVMPDPGGDAAAMKAYRGRLNDAAGRYLAPRWAGEVTSYLRDVEASEMLDEHAKRLRARQAAILEGAEDLGSLASAIENRGRLA